MNPRAMTPNRVVAIRKALDITQERLAHLLGVTWTTVSRWEIGASSPTGLPLKLLVLLEGAAHNSEFIAELRDPRSADPMFALYHLLEIHYDEVK